jgi:hypothetical protein
MIGRRRTEADRIRARLAEAGVLVAAPPTLPRAAENQSVPTIDALVKLSEQCGSPVVHVEDQWTGADVFFVDDGGTRYRYRAAGRPDRFRRPVRV